MKLKRRVNQLTTMVLLQLAFTDFIGVMPTFFIGYCLLQGRDFDPPSTSILVVENIIGWLGNLMPLAAIYLVTILSFGRFLAIYRSFDYQIIMSQRNTGFMCAVGWLLAAAVACIPYYGKNHYKYDPNVCFMFVSLKETFPGFTTRGLTSLFIVINLVLVIVPAFFMIFCCMAVIIRLRTHKFLVPSNQAKDKSAAHAANTVLMITVAFILCYGPYFLSTADNLLKRVSVIDKNWMLKKVGLQTTVYLVIVVHFMCMALNSCINPCIYYLRAKKFRDDAVSTIKKMGHGFATSFNRVSQSKVDNNSSPRIRRSYKKFGNRLEPRYSAEEGV